MSFEEDMVIDDHDVSTPEADVTKDAIDVERLPSTRGRRMALADIFEDVNDNEMVRVLSLYVRHQISKAVNKKWLGRRDARPDIFEDFTFVDIENISNKACVTATPGDPCDSSNDLTSSSCSDSTSFLPRDVFEKLRHRRGGKCDIFEGLSIPQRQQVLDKFCEHLNTMEQFSDSNSDSDNDFSPRGAKRKPRRRGGKFDIFEGLTEEQRLVIIQNFVKNVCDEQSEMQQENCR